MTRRVHFFAAAVVVLGLSGCSAAAIDSQGDRISQSRTYDLRLPVSSILERRYARVVRQQYDFSCGAAALATLLTFQYGDVQTEQSVFLGMWNGGDRDQIRKVGFSLLEMKRYLATRHLNSNGYRVSLDQIEQAALPGIALINVDQYRHFVVVKGLDRDSVLLGDPSLGIRRISRREFQTVWNGVYFALDTQAPAERPVFDLAADRSLAPRAVSPIDIQPVDLQILALTRPRVGLGEL